VKPGGTFVTVVSPLLGNMDRQGVMLGGVSAGLSFLSKAAEVRNKYS